MSTLTKAGRYELREELGRGAMGVVYLANDPVIGRNVAVKMMRISEAGTGMTREQLVARFQTEARAAGLLTHPNIVVVFDAGEEDGQFYITMELVEGRSLQSQIDARQLFPLARVLKVMEQVCSALDFAHQHNVVHRDIKPANLVLTADDTVKVTDFGTAKILQLGTAQTSHVMGTPSYMSPEQVKGRPVDGRSDIFSLGVILYELMTGEKPFPGENITTVIYKIINEEPIPPRSLDSTIHPGLSAVISRALAKNPAARFQSCHELMEALRNYREMASPDATVALDRSSVPPPKEGDRTNTRSERASSTPNVSHPTAKDSNPGLQLALPPQEERRLGGGGKIFLSLILIAVIAFAGYRISPPLLDLWQRAKEEEAARKIQAVTAAKNPTANPSPVAVDTTNITAPAAPASDVAEVPAPIASAAATPASPKSAAPVREMSEAPRPPAAAEVQPPAPREPVEPRITPKNGAAQPSAEKNRDPLSGAANPGQSAQTSPAARFETYLRLRLDKTVFGPQVKTQAVGNTLTLSGQLTPMEHTRLLNQLRYVPANVRVVDDIENSPGEKETSSSFPTPTSTPTPTPAPAGWVWVRSEPLGARIFLDGKDTGLRAPVRVEMPPGEHVLRLELEGFSSANRTVDVRSGLTIQITQILERP